MNDQPKPSDAQNIIKTHVMVAMGAGLVPLPLLDIAAVTAVQLDMLRSLCNLYGQDFYEAPAKGLITALTGSTLARLGASLVKTLPGVGTLLGGISMSLMSGASTYAVGQAFRQHFSQGGKLSDFDPRAAREYYEAELERGKQAAKAWKQEGSQKPPPASADEGILEKLERLAKLKEDGLITEAEFQEMKMRLLTKL